MESAWRFEVKYRISVFEHLMIRNALRPYMVRDRFTELGPGRRYGVRSLYYDTYDYRLYQEKMSGDHERIKFRLRTYSTDIRDNPVIRAEMKVRMGNAMEKHAARVTPEACLGFLRTGHWPEGDDPVLTEFERHVHLWSLRPVVLIDYQREGYQDRAGEGIRITFDHKVRGTHGDTLFPVDPVFFREFHPGIVVLEIKCRHDRPAWLNRLVREFGLRWVANSKFTQGIQSARRDLWYPGGVVVVR